MADHNKPTLSSTYSNFITEVDGRLDDIAVGLDPAVTTATNVPTNAIRWSSAAATWQKWNGTAWNSLASSYSININGTVGATTPASGAFTTLSATGNVTLGDAAADTVTVNGTVQPGVVISGSSTGPALRITQTGTSTTSDALVVEDSANPDSTPFVIDSSGNVVVGFSAQPNLGAVSSAGLTMVGTSAQVGRSAITQARFDNSSNGVRPTFYKSRASDPGQTPVSLVSGDSIATLQFFGDDGTVGGTGVEAARINFAVDGTTSTGAMPGRIQFYTSSSGSGTPTERMRIDSSGRLLIGSTASYVIDGITAGVQNSGVGQDPSSLSLINWSNSSTTEANLQFAKPNGNSIGTYAALASGDNIGSITFSGGASSSAMVCGAYIFVETEGAFTTTAAPSRMIFATGGSASVAAERMRIDSAGGVAVGTTNTTTARFAVLSSAAGDNLTLGYFGATSSATGASAAAMHIIAASNKMTLQAQGGDILTFQTNGVGTDVLTLDTSNNVLVTGAGGLGYGTGSGGTVTQATSRTTGVTLNKPTGAITMFSAAGSTTAATFTVTNSLVAATDTIVLSQKSGTNLYDLMVTAVASGSFNITFRTTGGTATDAPVINFAVIKGATA